MKRRTISLALCATILLTGCSYEEGVYLIEESSASTEPSSDENESSTTEAEQTTSEESTTEPETSSPPTIESEPNATESEPQGEHSPLVDEVITDDAEFTVSCLGGEAKCNAEQNQEMKRLLSELVYCEKQVVIVDGSQDWQITVDDGNGNLTVYTRMKSDDGYVIMDSGFNIYMDSAELGVLVYELEYGLTTENGDVQTPAEGALFTVSCTEPVTREEYRDAGVLCVTKWLESMQGDDIEMYYRNTSFTIAPEEKNNYLSCGMVNGRKEFVVEVCFTAEDEGNRTLYDQYYQQGRYTEAGTYWSGNYFCGRFCYENGTVSLLKIVDRDSSKKIQEGLTGIQQGGYKNFYEFARRPDLEQAIEESFEYYRGYVVSKNLTLTSDGREINLDIYQNSYTARDDGTIYGNPDFRTYIDGQATYSTGVYFTDHGTSTKYMDFPQDFKLTFENYTDDANPDYAVRYDYNDEGAFYVIEAIQSDGRVFNESGRAYSGGVYVAGCFDPSPRLQRTDSYRYIGWNIDENGKYYPTYNTNKLNVGIDDETLEQFDYEQYGAIPRFNMYSERYYLPDDLRIYSEDENSVICYLWNNTDKVVANEGTYSIQQYKDGAWITIAEEISVQRQSIQPREYAEISYDISSLTNRESGKYRIVQSCGADTAYGAFWLGGGVEKASLGLSDIEVYTHASGFTTQVMNYGASSAKVNKVSFTDGRGSEYQVKLMNEVIVPADGSAMITVLFRNGVPMKGEYTLSVGNASAKVNVLSGVTAENYFNVDVQSDGAGATLTVTADFDGMARVMNSLQCIDYRWYDTCLMSEKDYYSFEKGVPVEIKVSDMTDEMVDIDFSFLYETYREMSVEELAEFNKGFHTDIPSTDLTIEEFMEEIISSLRPKVDTEKMLLLNITDENWDGNIAYIKW